jgi:GMP synthase PP-ATPase subunit
LDLEDVRKVSKEEGETYGKEIKAAFFQEISSKTGENVKEVGDIVYSCSTNCPNTSTKSTNRPRATRN